MVRNIAMSIKIYRKKSNIFSTSGLILLFYQIHRELATNNVLFHELYNNHSNHSIFIE